MVVEPHPNLPLVVLARGLDDDRTDLLVREHDDLRVPRPLCAVQRGLLEDVEFVELAEGRVCVGSTLELGGRALRHPEILRQQFTRGDDPVDLDDRGRDLGERSFENKRFRGDTEIGDERHTRRR